MKKNIGRALYFAAGALFLADSLLDQFHTGCCIIHFLRPPLCLVWAAGKRLLLSDSYGFCLSFVFKEFGVGFFLCLWYFDDGVLIDAFERLFAYAFQFFCLDRDFAKLLASGKSFFADGGDVGADHYFGQSVFSLPF